MNKREIAKKMGYKRRDSISHRPYNRETSLARFHRTGSWAHSGTGEGHKAGFNWAMAVRIEPKDRHIKYSKNSPSFDEGVYEYKHSHRLSP
jgi:hypothetical protein